MDITTIMINEKQVIRFLSFSEENKNKFLNHNAKDLKSQIAVLNGATNAIRKMGGVIRGSSLYESILDTAINNYRRYGDRAYKLSEKQVSALCRELQQEINILRAQHEA